MPSLRCENISTAFLIISSLPYPQLQILNYNSMCSFSYPQTPSPPPIPQFLIYCPQLLILMCCLAKPGCWHSPVSSDWSIVSPPRSCPLYPKMKIMTISIILFKGKVQKRKRKMKHVTVWADPHPPSGGPPPQIQLCFSKKKTNEF